MHWTDTAIVLSCRKFGENGAILRLLTPQHGVYGGGVRAAHSKANRGNIQPGNVVSASWQARLSEQLGTLTLELLAPHAAHLMADSARLSALTAACAMVEACLPERHPYPRLFAAMQEFLGRLQAADHWQQAYIELELALLAEAGFGLDLLRCAATGGTRDLVYVSPKSGRAVSRHAGAPYHEKMLPLPGFLRGEEETETDIADGFTLTGYFLEHWLLEPHGRKMPAARQRCQQALLRCAPAKNMQFS